LQSIEAVIVCYDKMPESSRAENAQVNPI